MSIFEQRIEWDEQLIQRYDLAGPRYMSYPTVPHFRNNLANRHCFVPTRAATSRISCCRRI